MSHTAKQRIVPTNLKTGMVWNMASLGFLAIAGLALNILIARAYGSETLGVFNIAFALYIFASQFGAFGIHMSVLQSVSHLMKDDAIDHEAVDRSITSAILAVLGTTSLATLISLLLIPLAGLMYADKAPGLTKACLVILPGLWAFSLNKVLLAVVNGARMMRVFASLQALRYVIMLACFAGLAAREVSPFYLTVVFSITELTLLPILIFACTRVVTKWRTGKIGDALQRHGWFGTRVFLSGAILELNTRVDVLMLGFFQSAETAGLYTVAALFVDGASQAIFAIRNSINPEISLRHNRNPRSLLSLSRKTALYMPVLMVLLSIAAWFAYPLFVRILLEDTVFLQARTPLLILLLGLAISSGVLTFNMLFSQLKMPGTHTFYVFSILLTNIALNLALIPFYGLMGAALATSISFIMAAVLLVVMARLILDLRLVF